MDTSMTPQALKSQWLNKFDSSGDPCLNICKTSVLIAYNYNYIVYKLGD